MMNKTIIKQKTKKLTLILKKRPKVEENKMKGFF